ncbi:UDP-glucose:glycoprotein glucosyltransferase-domain-containing protein [Lipomyces arxii]|uniref:UDP-glucose:glycoprotein glucosyltransferase-domain-containing protein n=1 Tax=Lipomyces arxii TaxID=56418 RepID=UPI0034CE8507
MFWLSQTSACQVTNGLLLVLILAIVKVAAAPSIQVRLDAPWKERSPYILEIAETVAEEIPKAYFPLLTHLVEFAHDQLDDQVDKVLDAYKLTHKSIYDEALAFCDSQGYSAPGGSDWINIKLGLRTSAPKIQAYYQYYNGTVLPRFASEIESCKGSTWFWYNGQVICDSTTVFALPSTSHLNDVELLPFDHAVSTKSDIPTAILYADITSPKFLAFHSALLAEAEGGKLRYIIRFKPSDPETADRFPERPSGLSGYGIELALKRTDYIVIDDRQHLESLEGTIEQTVEKEEPAIEGLLETLDEKDIEPLSMMDLDDISLRTAAYIMFPHEDIEPMEILTRITEDFPKLASTISAAKLSNAGMIQYEMAQNLGTRVRGTRFSHGDNAIYVNGARLDSVLSDEIISMLDIFDRERSLIYELNSLNVSNADATKLISEAAVLNPGEQASDSRFDYRDDIEGGDAIIYLNNLESDFKYKKMSNRISTILDPHYPGQFHQIRKNVHVIVMPLDLSSLTDLYLLAKHIRPLIQQGIPIRFGIVPAVETPVQRTQASIFYYFYSNYGLTAAITYAEESINHNGFPSKTVFKAIQEKSKLRREAPTVDVDPFKYELGQLVKAEAWAKRLDVSTSQPVVFGNGVIVPKDDGSWLQNIAYKLENDVSYVQKLVRNGVVTDRNNVQDTLLKSASIRRNKLIFPDDVNQQEYIDIVSLFKTSSEKITSLPKIVYDAKPSVVEEDAEDVTLSEPLDISALIASDFDSPVGIRLFLETLKFLSSEGLQDNIQVRFLHNPGSEKNAPMLSTLISYLSEMGILSKISPSELYDALKDVTLTEDFIKLPHIENLFQMQSNAKTEGWAVPDNANAFNFWESERVLAETLGLMPGQGLALLNTRVIRLTSTDELEADDWKSLLAYESAARFQTAAQAASNAGLLTELKSGVNKFDFILQLASVISRSEDLDVSGGFFFSTATRNVLINNFTMVHCGFDVGGDFDNAMLKVVAVMDPASEFAQKHVPLLNVLSEIEDVVVRVYLNPATSVDEMPIKRFYRNAITAAPQFGKNGSLIEPVTVFNGIPSEVLLTLGMDVASAWLVTPEVSKYDLDNIVLSSVTDPKVEATYVLKNILVQGHVRDMSRAGSPPAGLQLTLGTDSNPQMADTIVMANLGYLQFKSGPGVWKLGLKRGPSETIYKIDSAGAHGYVPTPVDENNVHVYVTKLSGITIYPRVRRNKGQETASVYGRENEVPLSPGYIERIKQSFSAGFKQWLAERPMTKTVFDKIKNFIVPPKVAPAWKSSGLQPSSYGQAAINIFSVASGHLYERFLNIMFVSVMRHTNETVKFWLIDNFLSPSFKEFLPYMAKEYNFDYEFITYKWPHWLRAQTEKQRIIWGYKILFLDVMFPLDLDKVIFVDADQIVRTDMKELMELDLEGAPYGYTPMCDSRKEIEGFRFWKQGYWKSFLGDKPYHISALYVIDLIRFRQLAAGDRLRGQYHQLSADPQSLSNLDQDLPNNMQGQIPIHSLPQDWLWCETWCSDESLKTAKTIDLCNNPMTKEPKLDRARRQLPEWTVYDNEIAAFANRVKIGKSVVGGEPGAESKEPEIKTSIRVKDEL